MFYVCDELQVFIEARNLYDGQKAYGADFFRANFFTQNETYSAGTSSDGEVVDHLNGTYSAYFTLKGDGILRINVTLVWWV